MIEAFFKNAYKIFNIGVLASISISLSVKGPIPTMEKLNHESTRSTNGNWKFVAYSSKLISTT